MSNLHLSVAPLRQRTNAARLRFERAIFTAAAVLLSSLLLSAQSAPSASTVQPSSATKPSAHRPAKPSPAPQEQTSQVPQQAETPHWPVNDTPAKPEVTWNSQGLKIDATNASLHQILDDVSTATGAKIEGFGADERVFGEYGPGQARDVISQLLHGSGYNVLMIGDQGEGTPRQVILSTRKAATSPGQPAVNRAAQEMAEEDVPDQPEPEEQPQPLPVMNGRPPVIPPPQGPPGAPRTPQQVLQELQQRQQQMQDQQQQQQQQQQQPH
jgi:hypothetical protein